MSVPDRGSGVGCPKESFWTFMERKYVDGHVWRVEAKKNESLTPSFCPQSSSL